MDGAQFAKMLSDKHLFELNRMEYKYSTISVKEFAELLQAVIDTTKGTYKPKEHQKPGWQSIR